MPNIGNGFGLASKFIAIFEIALVFNSVADILENAEGSDFGTIFIVHLDGDLPDVTDFTTFEHQSELDIDGLVTA